MAKCRPVYRGGRRHRTDMSLVVQITLSCRPRVLRGHKVTSNTSTTDIGAGTHTDSVALPRSKVDHCQDFDNQRLFCPCRIYEFVQIWKDKWRFYRPTVVCAAGGVGLFLLFAHRCNSTPVPPGRC